MNNRVLYSDNGLIFDLSMGLSSTGNGSRVITYTTNQDAIYIGSRLPFNHVYFKIVQPSTSSATIKVEYHNESGWVEVVDVMDDTTGLSRSGVLQFTPSKHAQWTCKSSNEIPEISSKTIYDLYWLKITLSQNADIIIDYIGSCFSNDVDLAVEYPDLVKPNTITSFRAGKTSWEDQHIRASSILIDDLINSALIDERGQILNWRDYTSACVQKVAEIAFSAFGDDYKDQVISARREYNDRLLKRVNKIDKNNNAIEEKAESFSSTGFFTR